MKEIHSSRRKPQGIRKEMEQVCLFQTPHIHPRYGLHCSGLFLSIPDMIVRRS